MINFIRIFTLIFSVPLLCFGQNPNNRYEPIFPTPFKQFKKENRQELPSEFSIDELGNRLFQKQSLKTTGARVEESEVFLPDWQVYYEYANDTLVYIDSMRYTYNHKSELVNRTVYRKYSEDAQTWSLYYRGIYDYDQNGNRTLLLAQYCQGTEWATARTYTYAYDENNNLTLEERLFEEISEWGTDSRYTYAYDTEGNRTLERYQFRRDTDWENNFQFFYTYDDRNYLINELRQDGRNVTEWEDSYSAAYEYDANGNMTSFVEQLWRDNQWQNFSFNAYEYDQNGKLSYHFEQVGGGDIWENHHQTFYEYDADGNQTLLFMQNWYENAWVNGWEELIEYDANGNQTLVRYREGSINS